MKSLFLALSVLVILVTNSVSHAQQLNVIQVKGNRAIVEIQTGEKLKVGESYAVGKVDGEVIMEPVETKKGNRNYLVGMDLTFSNTKDDTANATTQIEFDGTIKFGWNKRIYEYGPLVSLDYKKNGSLKPEYTFGIGAFGSYNFQPNNIGTELIFSGDLDLQYKLTNTPSGDSYNAMSFTVGPFVKWFGVSDDHCVRGGLVFAWNHSSPATSDVTTTGLKAVIGLSTYF